MRRSYVQMNSHQSVRSQLNEDFPADAIHVIFHCSKLDIQSEGNDDQNNFC